MGSSNRSLSPTVTIKTAVDADTPVITPAEVGEWLNLSAGMVTLKTSVINRLIRSTVQVVEKYTWLALRRTTYQAYFDLQTNDFFSFYDGSLQLELQRAPILNLADITTIEYLNTAGEWVTFDRGAMTVEGLYENTTEAREHRQWASILFRENLPLDNERDNAYKIRVTFTSGFDNSDEDLAIPEPLLTGMLMVVAFYYTNRGDCSGCDCNLNGYPVPCEAKGLIDMYSIAKTTLGGSYNLINDTNGGRNC